MLENWFRDNRDIFFTPAETRRIEQLRSDDVYKTIISKLKVIATQKYLYERGERDIFHGTLVGLDMLKSLASKREEKEVYNQVTGKKVTKVH